METDFDDLDHWDEFADEAPKAPKAKVVSKSEPEPSDAPNDESGPDESTIGKEPTAAAPAPTSSHSTVDSLPDEGLSPPVRSDLAPVSLRPHLGLNKTERIGLVALAVMLVVGGVFFLTQSVHRLPTEAERVRSQDFPVKGGRIQVEAASSFWREPNESDVVRRGTALVPAVELSVSGGPAAIRVFFLNDRGERIGDPINREVNGNAKLSFSATAGFEDLSMHAAYRTGETKPWSILVLEGGSSNAAGEAFKQLFEMSISTDRR